jgi:precorrin-6Y C5,15-methyltransferase (decarboxylating)
MPKGKVYIVGVAPSGATSLLPEASRLLERAEMVFGGRRLLDMFPSISGEKIAVRNNLAEVTGAIKRNLGRKRMVVLASGDPNLYGIASYLTAKLGSNAVDIIPNVSAMQLAFARIKESWQDAVFLSVHSRPIEDIVETVRLNNKLGIFTDDKHTPADVARVLLEHGVDGYRAYVCQDLGGKDEKVIKTDLGGLAKIKPSPLNILILLREKSRSRPPQILGIPETSFYRRPPHRANKGFITKQEVRAVSLAKLALTENSIVWDIGAGSGAISIEASFLARKGRVFTIEKNDKDIAIIRKNLNKFNAPNVEVIKAFAPDGLGKLPAPTAVFIGGSGGRMKKIVDFVSRKIKPGGRIVLNIVALENLSTAVDALRARGFLSEVTLINTARSTGVAELTRLEALDPVFVVTGVRKE